MGAFQGHWNTTATTTATVNWLEANQFAIYKCGREVETGSTGNKFTESLEWVSNLGTAISSQASKPFGCTAVPSKPVHGCNFYIQIVLHVTYCPHQGFAGPSHPLQERSRDGLVVIALAPHQCGRVRFWTCGHMWVKFVVGSLLCSERFCYGFSGFPLSSKTVVSKFQVEGVQDLSENHFRVSGAS